MEKKEKIGKIHEKGMMKRDEYRKWSRNNTAWGRSSMKKEDLKEFRRRRR